MLSSGYSTIFTKKRITDDVKYSAIKTHIYSALSIEELTSMKFKERNILEVKASSFLASCSSCCCDTNSEKNLIICSTTDSSFKLCSKNSCHHIIDNNNYCANCKRASIIILDKEKISSDCEKERIFEDEFNEDCVTVFLNDQQDNDDDDDEANVITAAGTMVSIACTSHCNNMPSYSCNVLPFILTSPDYDKFNKLNEALEFPAIEHLDTIINKCSESASSRMSDLSVSESVFYYTDTFMMKVNKYDDSNENIKALTNTSPLVSEEEKIKMNLH